MGASNRVPRHHPTSAVRRVFGHNTLSESTDVSWGRQCKATSVRSLVAFVAVSIGAACEFVVSSEPVLGFVSAQGLCAGAEASLCGASWDRHKRVVSSASKTPCAPASAFRGQCVPQKGWTILAAGEDAVTQKYELVIVSNDPQVKEQSLDDNTILVYGLDHSKLSELVSWFQSSHLFAFPTWYEPFGLVLIESAACGTPAISRDLGLQGEAVEHEGSGLLMPYHSTPEEWAEAIQGLLADRERLDAYGKRARQLAEERFSLHRLRFQIREVVTSLLG